jgi:hypothetical protein
MQLYWNVQDNGDYIEIETMYFDSRKTLNVSVTRGKFSREGSFTSKQTELFHPDNWTVQVHKFTRKNPKQIQIIESKLLSGIDRLVPHVLTKNKEAFTAELLNILV